MVLSHVCVVPTPTRKFAPFKAAAEEDIPSQARSLARGKMAHLKVAIGFWRIGRGR